MLALVQAARRLPAGLRRRLEPRSGNTVWHAFAAWLADHPETTRQILARRSPGTRGGDRLAEMLAIALGEDSIPATTPSGRARELWQVGRLSEAEATVAGTDSALARRIGSERRLLQPGVTVGLRTPTPVTGGSGVLMALTNCRPWTRSGYTARSQQILRALTAQGIRAEAVTRIGYPVTVGLVARPVVHTVEGVRYHRLPVAGLEATIDARAGQQAHLIRRLAERMRPAVLHTTTDYTNAVAVRAVAEATGLPWIYEMRGMLELTWIASRPEQHRAAAAASERVRLLRAKEAELARAADAVICLSRVQRDDLVSRGVPIAKILVAPNAVDAALFERHVVSPAEARERLGLPRDGCWFGTVTSMVDYEGLDTLVRAIAAARAAGVDARGALVGDGVARPALQRLVCDLGLDGVVVLPGRVPPDQALAWHEALDVFCVPRRDTPVCRMVTPLKPLEAMALGRPVLASDLPALAEIIQDPGAGRLLPPGQVDAWAAAFAHAAESEAERTATGTRRRAGVARHTWSRLAADYADLYSRVSHRPIPTNDQRIEEP